MGERHTGFLSPASQPAQGSAGSGHAGGLHVLAYVTWHRVILAEGIGNGRVVCVVGFIIAICIRC